MKQATANALGEARDGFRFRGGHDAIDLTATLAARLKPSPRELLKTPDDLARWLVAANLCATPPEVDAADLVLAHALREAIYTLATALVSGGPDAAEARETLNRVAAMPPAVPRLVSANRMELVGTTSALLATLAGDAVHLFSGDLAGRIRQCQSPTCTLFFVDTSRAGDRRWCSMAACGNKAKVAEFRRRKRQVGGDAPA